MRSTLMISAPKSARIIVAVGPATTVLRSRTLMPVSGGGKTLKIAYRDLRTSSVSYYRRMTSAFGARQSKGEPNLKKTLTIVSLLTLLIGVAWLSRPAKGDDSL